MSVEACAALVERADPDRWRAVLAAPVAARRVLLPLYAFNNEVARAPWLTQEPLIAEMRLQWWVDVLDEIAEGRPVRRHEVSTPLADVLDANAAAALIPLVEARRRDVNRVVFQSIDEAQTYVSDTAGRLAWVGAERLGAGPEARATVEALATAGGLARLLIATPELERRGWRLWRAISSDALSDAVTSARRAFKSAQSGQGAMPRLARAALLPDWRASALLELAEVEPDQIGAGGLALSPFLDRALLLKASVTGRI